MGRQVTPPIVANVFVEIGMRLHEEEPATDCRDAEFVGHSPGTVFLLCRGVDQYVAVRQQAVQPLEVVPLGLRFRRVRVGTVDEHDVAQQRNLDPCDVEFVDRKPNRGQISLRMCQKERANRGGRCRPVSRIPVPRSRSPANFFPCPFRQRWQQPGATRGECGANRRVTKRG